jgi:hypothetical protein
MEIPDKPPPAPPKLRAYLMLLAQAVRTAQPIAGRNVSISVEEGKGTVVNAEDCAPCPPP